MELIGSESYIDQNVVKYNVKDGKFDLLAAEQSLIEQLLHQQDLPSLQRQKVGQLKTVN